MSFKSKIPRKDEGKIWKQIVDEEQQMQDLYDAEKLANLHRPKFDCVSNYLHRELFPPLVAIFQEVCAQLLAKNAPDEPGQFFNGLDGIAEILYKTNPSYPRRIKKWYSIYEVYETMENRPTCPLHWVLIPDEAAVMIQALVRGFLTRMRYDLVEMKRIRQMELENLRKQTDCQKSLKDKKRKCRRTAREMSTKGVNSYGT